MAEKIRDYPYKCECGANGWVDVGTEEKPVYICEGYHKRKKHDGTSVPATMQNMQKADL